MKMLKKIIVYTSLIGLLGTGISEGAIPKGAEETTNKPGIECIAEEGTNIFGQHYIIPGVTDENGSCIALQDTAPKITNDKTTYDVLDELIKRINTDPELIKKYEGFKKNYQLN